MGYEVSALEDVPVTDLGEVEEIPADMDIRSVGEALGLDEMRGHVWYFEEGDEVGYHAHAEQEEFFFVLEGRFELTLGPPGDTETVEVGPGTFWAVEPETGRGHRCVSDDGGAVLALGAPAVEDMGKHPSEFE